MKKVTLRGNIKGEEPDFLMLTETEFQEAMKNWGKKNMYHCIRLDCLIPHTGFWIVKTPKEENDCSVCVAVDKDNKILGKFYKLQDGTFADRVRFDGNFARIPIVTSIQEFLKSKYPTCVRAMNQDKYYDEMREVKKRKLIQSSERNFDLLLSTPN